LTVSITDLGLGRRKDGQENGTQQEENEIRFHDSFFIVVGESPPLFFLFNFNFNLKIPWLAALTIWRYQKEKKPQLKMYRLIR
jgi:hypothetical protein